MIVKLKEVEVRPLNRMCKSVSLKWMMHIEILKSNKACDSFLKISFPLNSLKGNYHLCTAYTSYHFLQDNS